MPLDEPYVRYLTGLSLGRLATVGSDGGPQIKPVNYRYNPVLSTIDIGGFNMGRSAKYHNVGINPQVAFVVDDVIGDGTSGLRFLEIRGLGEQARTDLPGEEGPSSYLIRIHPRRLVSWNIDPEHPGMQACDIDAAR
jgi:pyridoxamine 5'-phosphate oxidase family protein